MPRVTNTPELSTVFFQRPSLLPFCREEEWEDFRSIIYQICKLSQKVQRVFTPNKATSQAWQLEKDWQKRRDDTRREGGKRWCKDYTWFFPVYHIFVYSTIYFYLWACLFQMQYFSFGFGLICITIGKFSSVFNILQARKLEYMYYKFIEV